MSKSAAQDFKPPAPVAARDARERMRDLLRSHHLFASAEPRLIDALLQFATTKVFQADAAIFRKGEPGDALYGILEGRARVFVEGPDGREVILNILEAGSIFGEIALLDGSTRTASVAALEKCKVLRLPRAHFLPILRREPDLALNIIELLCQRLRWTSAVIEDSAFLDLRGRLAKRLLVLADTFGQSDARGTRIKVRLTQKSLAAMLMVTREAVNKQVAEWRENGVIEMDDGYIVVRDLATLTAMVIAD